MSEKKLIKIEAVGSWHKSLNKYVRTYSSACRINMFVMHYLWLQFMICRILDVSPRCKETCTLPCSCGINFHYTHYPLEEKSTYSDRHVSDVTKCLTSCVASQEYQSTSWPVVSLPQFSFASCSQCSTYGMPQLSHPAPAEPTTGQPSNATWSMVI